MKRIARTLAAILCGCIFFNGCSTGNNTPANTSPPGETATAAPDATAPIATEAKNAITGPLSEYIVMKENTAYIYTDEEYNVGGYTSYVEYTADGLVQRRIDAGTEALVEVMRFTDTSLELYYTEYNYHRHENLLDRTPNISLVSIAEPLGEGVSWTYHDETGKNNDVINEVTAVDMEITVPYGTFNALELTKTYVGNDVVVKEYYVKGIGLIKSSTINASITLSSSLSSIQENVQATSNVPMFYMQEGARVQDVYSVQFYTNMDVLATNNDLIGTHFSAAFGIPAETLYMERVDVDAMTASRATVYLTSAFTAASLSADAVLCLADSIGYMYGVNEVVFMQNSSVVLFNDVVQDGETNAITVRPLEAEDEAGEEAGEE